MDQLDNPYTPNAGAKPSALVGRDDLFESFRILLHRLRKGRTAQSMVITGLRGVGKTVVLGRLRDLALASEWVVVEMEISKHDDNRFRRDVAAKLRTALLELSPRAQWNDRFQTAARVLTSFTAQIGGDGQVTFGLDVEPLEGRGDHGNLPMDLTDLFVAVGEAAQSRERGMVLLVDEIQFLSAGQLEALISALHKCVQRALPITLVGAGLPQIAELAGDAQSYAERLFTFPRIGNLDEHEAARALQEPARSENARFTDQALATAYEITAGYPYFIQELGHAVWPVAQNRLISADDVRQAVPYYESKLDDSFFRVRLDRATEMQRVYLRAMAELGPGMQKAQAVAAMMGRESSQVAPLRAELINIGLLYTPEHGYAAFTVPQFESFLRRAIPVLDVPPARSRKKT